MSPEYKNMICCLVMLAGCGSGEEGRVPTKEADRGISFDECVLSAIRTGKGEVLRPLLPTTEHVHKFMRALDPSFTRDKALQSVEKGVAMMKESITYARMLLRARGMDDVEKVAIKEVLGARSRLDSEWQKVPGPPKPGGGEAYRIYRLEVNGKLADLVCGLSYAMADQVLLSAPPFVT